MKSTGDDAGTRAWESLLRVHAQIVTTLEHEVERQTGTPLAWYDVLLELERARDRRLRMSDLGERVVLSRSRVSRIVDEMVAHDLVTKLPDPTDGRATLAAMTPNGRATLKKAAPVYLAGIERHFARHLTETEAEMLSTMLGRILADEDKTTRSRRG